MDNIGEFLKQIRLEKNLTQKEVIEGIGTLTYISKVENGWTNPTYLNLLKILDRMNVGPSEFFRATQLSSTNSQFELINRLAYLIQEKDIHLIDMEIAEENKKYKEDSNYRHTQNIILLNQYKNFILNISVDKRRIKELSDYLMNIRIWGMYEINLFNLCVIFFSNELNQILYRIAVKKLNKFLSQDQFYTYTIRIGFNILINTLEADDLTNAAVMIKQLEAVTLNTKYYYEIVKINFMRGIYSIKKGEIARGKEIATKAIEIMYRLGDEANARAHQRELNKYLEDKL